MKIGLGLVWYFVEQTTATMSSDSSHIFDKFVSLVSKEKNDFNLERNGINLAWYLIFVKFSPSLYTNRGRIYNTNYLNSMRS